MGFKCGIVGLPNVGKSTLFNALTETQAAQAANYPFCTIEPNVGQVAVPDGRLDKLAAIAGSQKIIPTQLAFVDIAGLVAASKLRLEAPPAPAVLVSGSMAAAHALYSGIFAVGSTAGFVSWLTAPSSP